MQSQKCKEFLQLIPSKDMREHFEKTKKTFTDTEWAAIIYNLDLPLLAKLEKLSYIAETTDDHCVVTGAGGKYEPLLSIDYPTEDLSKMIMEDVQEIRCRHYDVIYSSEPLNKGEN